MATSLQWLNIIGGLRDEFLNHVKHAVTQLFAAERTWEHIKETASVQQDHKSKRRTRSSSFSKGTVNYTRQRGKSKSPGTRGTGGGGGGGGGAGDGGGKKKQHWREKPSMRPSWVRPRHMTQDTCMVCNYTRHKAGQCKTATNKQNWSGWPATEPAVWPQAGGTDQNARAPPQQQPQQQPQYQQRQRGINMVV